MENNNFLKKIFLFFLIIFFIYFPSIFFDFSYFDDQVLILENFNFLKNLNNFWKAFQIEVFHTFGFSASYYRPILTLSFMLDAQISGKNPFFYHFSNIIYHLIATILVYIFLKKLKIEEEISFYLSLFFALHPVLTQAVSWIPGRNDSLLTIFALSCFIFLINYLEKRNFLDLFFYFFFFTLSLFTKESAILVPFFSLLFIILFYKDKKMFLMEIFFGWWFIFLFWVILRQRVLNNVLYLSLNDILKGLIFNSAAIIQYFGKIFFPFNLSVLPTIKDTTFFWGVLAILVFIVIIIFSQKINFKKFVFGLFWFIFFLIPNFIRPNIAITADFLEHRVYLPLVGVLVSFCSLNNIEEFLKNKKSRIFVYFVLVVFAVITFIHQFQFKNRLVFWKNAITASPNSPLAHRNYGVMLYFEGKIKEAEKEYKKSLQLNEKEPMVYNNLGVIYMNQKRWQLAIDYFNKELEINPNYDNALYNLGVVYYQLGEKEKAKDYWEKTIRVNPNYLSAYQNLAVYFAEKKDDQQAKKYLLIYQKLKGE